MHVNSPNGLTFKFAWLLLFRLYITLFIFSGIFFLLFITPAFQPVLWTYLLTCAGLIIYLLKVETENFRLDPKMHIHPAALGLALLAAVSLFIVRDILLQLLPLPSVQPLSFAAVNVDSAATIIGSVFVLPLMEELLFRGILLESLLKTQRAPAALLTSSFISTLATLDPAYLLPNFLLGLVCGMFYLRVRHLCPVIFIHLLYNIANAVVLLNGRSSLADLLNDQALYFVLVVVAFMLVPTVYYLLQRINAPLLSK